MKRNILIAVAVWICTTIAAQRTCISGIITAISGEGLPNASIRVLANDSTQLAIAFTDKQGKFSVPLENTQGIMLFVSCIGYESLHYLLEPNNEKHPLHLTMESKAAALQGVTITAKRNDANGYWTFKIDDALRKNIYNGYDAIALLMLPGVHVDRQTQRVTLLDNDIPIYIDGRRADKRDVLSLRKHEIETIQYHDFPTGRFAGDMAAINIQLKKNTGWMASLTEKKALASTNGLIMRLQNIKTRIIRGRFGQEQAIKICTTTKLSTNNIPHYQHPSNK